MPAAMTDKTFKAVPSGAKNDHSKSLVVVQSQSCSAVPPVIGLHYHVLKCIGEGSFGVIYEGRSDLNDRAVAIKFESRKSSTPQLKDEFRHYKDLSGEDGYNCMVLDLLGPSLEDLFDRCNRRFSVSTVCKIAIQLLDRLQSIHDCGLIYRDIKPDNFLLGPDRQTIYVVDFGMAKSYIDSKTQQHIPFRDKKALSGTARYMSINTHLGREQSRRDDLESLGHVLFYFLRGSLPWQGLKSTSNKEKYEMIGRVKQDTTVDALCSNCPKGFGQYLLYCRALKFDEPPDYGMCKQIFEQILATQACSDLGSFDWSHTLAVQTVKHPVHVLPDGPLEEDKKEPASCWLKRLFCLC